ncbi:MAG: Ig-like domain-containing protein [Actinomycetota bacterium]
MDTHGRIARWGRAAVATAIGITGLTALSAAPAQAAGPVVVSLTFDDGLTAQYNAASILEAHGARGTFYLNSGAIDQRGGGGTMTWAQARALEDAGHEIGGHTRDHTVLTNDLSAQDRWIQICEDRARMVEEDLHPTSFAYANGVTDPAGIALVRACGYQTARLAGGLLPTNNVNARVESVPPAMGAHEIRALGATDNGPVSLASLQAAVDAAYEAGGGWLPMLFHWVCDEADTTCMSRTRPVSRQVLEQFLTWVDADARDITVKPMSEVFNGGSAVPDIQVSSPVPGAGVPATPTFSGTTSADGQVTVDIFNGPHGLGSPIGTIVTTSAGGTWSAAPSGPMSAGTYSVRARVTAGGVTGTSLPVPFQVGAADTTGPAATITTPAEGAIATSTTVAFSGTGGQADGDLPYATLRIQGTPVSGAAVDRQLRVSIFPGGTWSLTPTIANGSYRARIIQSDRAGNTTTSPERAFTVDTNATQPPPADTTAPTVTITSPTAGQTVNTGIPTFAGRGGTASGDVRTATVEVFNGSTAVGTPVHTLTASIDDTGTWTISPTTVMPNGTYTVRATQRDAVPNIGTSPAVTFTVDASAPSGDTTPPAVTIANPANGATVGTATPALTGTGGVAPGEVRTVTVTIYSGAIATGTAVQTLSAAVASTRSWSVTAAALADGTYTARATQTDASSNTGTSNAVTFTVDTAAPTVTVSSPANGSTVANKKPAISGTGGAAATDAKTASVRIYSGTAATGTPVQTLTATVAGNGSWTATPTADLANGSYTVVASQADQAGNTGTSTPVTFTVNVATPPPAGGGGGGGGGGTPPPAGGGGGGGLPADTTAPSVSISSPANGSTVSDRPAFSGKAGTAAGDKGSVSLSLFTGTAAGGKAAQQLTAQVGKDGSWTVTSAKLAAGTYTAQATQKDDAGNTGTSNAVTFIVKSGVALPVEAMRADSVTRKVLPQGAQGLVLKVRGAGFADDARAAISGAGVTVRRTQVVGPGTLVLTVDVAEGAPVGARDLTVSAPGLADAVCSGCLRTGFGPRLRAMSGDTVGQGARKAVIRLFGQFGPGVKVTVSGEGVRTRILSRRAKVVRLGLWVAPDAAVGARTLTVTHRDGGRFTCTGCLKVAPAPKAAGMGRKALVRGSFAWLTLRGANFSRSTAVLVRGAGVRVDAVRWIGSGRIRVGVYVAPGARRTARTLVLVDKATKARSVLKGAIRIT